MDIIGDFSSILFQFLVLLNQYDRHQDPLSALSLYCLCPAGPTPCSCLNHSNTRPGISLCSRPRLGGSVMTRPGIRYNPMTNVKFKGSWENYKTNVTVLW